MMLFIWLLAFTSLSSASVELTEYKDYRNMTSIASFFYDLSPVVTKSCFHNVVPTDIDESRLLQQILMKYLNAGEIPIEVTSHTQGQYRYIQWCCNFFYYKPTVAQINLIIKRLLTKNECMKTRLYFVYDSYNETAIYNALVATENRYLDVFTITHDKNMKFRVNGLDGFNSKDVLSLGIWIPAEGWIVQPKLFWDKMRDLHNAELTVVGLPYIPCTGIRKNILEETGGNLTAAYYGLDITIIETVRKKCNFRYKIIEPWDRGWGVILPNKSWTGIVGYLQRREADIGIACTALNGERIQYFDTAIPHVVDFVGFVTSLPLDVPKWKALIFPFNIMVWAFIFATFITVALVSAFLFTYRMLPEMNESPEVLSWITMVKIFWTQGVPEKRLYTHGLPFFFAVWTLFSFFTTQAYICNLVSYFTASPKENAIDTVQELYESSLKIAFHYYGSQGTVFFKYSASAMLREIGERTIMWKDDPLDMLAMVVKGEYAFFDYATYLDLVVPQHYLNEIGEPEITFSQDKFLTPFSFMFPDQNPVGPLLDNYIRRLSETGHIKHWSKTIYDEYKVIKASSGDDSKALQISHVQGLFFVYFIGLGLGAVAFFMEHSHHETKKRLQARKNFRQNIKVAVAAEKFKAPLTAKRRFESDTRYGFANGQDYRNGYNRSTTLESMTSVG